jgi:phosphatidate cytidylyltransferase
MALQPDRNLFLRVASAVVGLPLVVVVIVWLPPAVFGGFALAAGALALYEYGGLLLPDWKLGRLAVVNVGVAYAGALYGWPDMALVAAMGAVIAICAVALWTNDVARAGSRLGQALFGVLYVGTLIVALPLLRRDVPHGSLWALASLAVTFANDTGAYFVGRAFGKHKLAPAISPGKTVEGAVGGLGAGLVIMYVAKQTFFSELTILDVLVVGVVAAVLGPVGDLVESLLKRSVGAKDSGRLIPGHGGMLDRIDALLFVGAYIYVHARYFHP